MSQLSHSHLSIVSAPTTHPNTPSVARVSGAATAAMSAVSSGRGEQAGARASSCDTEETAR